MNTAMQRFGECNQEFSNIVVGHIRDDVWVGRKGGRLEVRVDYYQPAPGEEWDVDRWDEEAVFIEVPETRECFRDAYRCARALLAGRDVWTCDGQVIPGRRAGRPAPQHSTLDPRPSEAKP